ncbi:hypothetical protein P7L87_23165 [Vibrio parahaemolyticus]|nr:hypothetical protein [Microvirga mediterraneensis]MDG2570477.1 hypothetical protein [Vibrio parahaemolyticus]
MDDAPLLEVPKTTPANDTLARVLEWVGLIAGIGLIAWAIAIAL